MSSNVPIVKKLVVKFVAVTFGTAVVAREPIVEHVGLLEIAICVAIIIVPNVWLLPFAVFAIVAFVTTAISRIETVKWNVMVCVFFRAMRVKTRVVMDVPSFGLALKSVKYVDKEFAKTKTVLLCMIANRLANSCTRFVMHKPVMMRAIYVFVERNTCRIQVGSNLFVHGGDDTSDVPSERDCESKRDGM